MFKNFYNILTRSIKTNALFNLNLYRYSFLDMWSYQTFNLLSYYVSLGDSFKVNFYKSFFIYKNIFFKNFLIAIIIIALLLG